MRVLKKLPLLIVLLVFVTGSFGQESPITLQDNTHILYEVFFEAVVAWDRRANTISGPAAHRDAIRDHMRKVAGLNTAQHEFLKSVAYWLTQALNENNQKANAILQDKSATRVNRRNSLDKLRSERYSLVHAALQKMRDQLGPLQFQEFDRRVRQHMLERLKIGRLGAGKQAEIGGKD